MKNKKQTFKSYGHFVPENREYVITNPLTPAIWANYLGSPEYGAIIGNNAEGYSFEKSGANGRLLRYRFNSRTEVPGRYIYFKNAKEKDFWSASYLPTQYMEKSDNYRTVHGTGYTRILSLHGDIETAVTYYVPFGQTYEVWAVEVINMGSEAVTLDTYGFCEFTNEQNYEQDGVNLQYSLFISKTEFDKNKIVQISKGNCKEAMEKKIFGTTANVRGYCGDRDKFLGFGGYGYPDETAEKKLSGSLNYCGNSCGALQTDFTLRPGGTKQFVFVLGQKNEKEADDLIAKYKDFTQVKKDLDELKTYWHGKLEKFQIESPSKEFNDMVNTWNAYQCFITFVWSRAASLIYCGLRNGYGYRDTVQDIQGIIHLDPESAAEKIRFMLSAQVDNGAGLPLVKFNHKAGEENTPEDPEYVKETGHPEYRADDALWLFPTIYYYVTESGNIDFLNEKIVYANNNKDATVYEHLKKAIDFSMNNLGENGLPAGLHADWNDCLRLGKRGESTFVAFQLLYAFDILKTFAEKLSDTNYVKELDKLKADLSKKLDECNEGDRFIRGIREDGVKVGSKSDPEANMWLNPQSWAVISGHSKNNRIMDTVYNELNTPYGARLLYPPYSEHYFDGALMHIYNKGVKENAGIFSQSQGWLVLAECILGRGNRAFEYYKENCPAYYNNDADVRTIEPYAFGQFTESMGDTAGRSHVHWLTGTASTMMVASVYGICGIKPTLDGIIIDPSIPSEWEILKIEKSFRGKNLNIEIKNPYKLESGVKNITVNGEVIEGNEIPFEKLANENDIKIILE
ncbi:MAG: N,N'-diacetylchitobiose phosphorylase [Ruminococcus sp.]|jgi:cellobiose phosphorylase|nr:N,N'-diacetylchitobiose phosphorylase [Ruminococcus sp.]